MLFLEKIGSMVLSVNHAGDIFIPTDALALFVQQEIKPMIDEDGNALDPAARHNAAASTFLLVAVDTPPVCPDTVARADEAVADAGQPAPVNKDMPAVHFFNLCSPHVFTPPR